MKFNKITYYSAESILDCSDFEDSIYNELCNELSTSWDNLLFSFDENEPDVDNFYGIILELEGISECRDISEELKIYTIGDLKYCVIDKDNGVKGICINIEDLQEFQNIINEYGI